jgi:hypothetical protein
VDDVSALAGGTQGLEMERIQIQQHSIGGMVWMAGWLFTVGALQLGFWRGLLAIVVWPYYLGVALRPLFQ